MQGAWKVGLLVVVFVGLLFGAYAILGKSLFAEKMNTFYADFPDAGGLAEGTDVNMAGVKIGTVKEIKLVNPKLARATLDIKPSYSIPAGSTAQTSTALIGIGNLPIDIVPPVQLTGGSLPPGSTIPGAKLSPLANLLPNAGDTLNELNKTLVAARNLISDKTLKTSVTHLIETSDKTVAQFGQLAQKADMLIDANRGALQQTLKTASLAMQDIRKTTQQVALLAQDPRWKDKATAILDNLNTTAKHADTLVTSLTDFVNDPKLRDPLRATAANTQTITDTGTRIAANAEEISKNGVTISENAKTFTEKANALADEAKTALQKITGVFGKQPSASYLSSITGNLDLIRESKPGHWRTDLQANFPIKDSVIHVGLFDAFETNKITAQLGKSFGHGNEYRYGIYASKPGVGVDFRLTPRLFARADLFDINNPRADIRLRYEIGNGFYGWLGMDQVFKKNAPLIGFGFRR